MKSSIVTWALLSVVPIAGQASYTSYGQGCNAFGTPTQIGARGTPRIGTTIIIGGSGGTLNLAWPYSVIGYLATGVSRTSYAGLPLPLRIPPYLINYGGLDCDMLCSVETWQNRGFASEIAIDIPYDHRLIGVRLYQQWYFTVVVRATPPFSFSQVSSGGEMTIGL